MAALLLDTPAMMNKRHTQDYANASALEPYWGYLPKVVPCTNDPGTCDYLDVVYSTHAQGILFVGIMWIVFGSLVFFYGIGRRFVPARHSLPSKTTGEQLQQQRQSFLHRAATATSSSLRRHVLKETPLRSIFGRTTRLQVAILAFLVTYLTIFTFVGFRYESWNTPPNKQGYRKHRTSLGPWSDRIGVMAYAIVPFSVLLSTRESLLSLMTGIPYQNFMFLHRWMGYIIFVQSALHTIGWCIIEVRLYQPQPRVWYDFITQAYAVWGVVAMVVMTLMLAMSLPPVIRRTGYEVFRKAHYVMAMIFIGACYGHWEHLGVFLIAALVVWGVDRFFRLARTFVLHYDFLPESTSAMRFQAADATVQHFPDQIHGNVVRLDFLHNHSPWQVGQHFYLCFPESSIWQSHPFTPLSLPGLTKGGQQHSYVFRAKSGETKKMAEIALRKLSATAASTSPEMEGLANTPPTQPLTHDSNTPSTKVILTGPCGTSHTRDLDNSPGINVLLIAGGTGITFVLPVLFHLMTAPTPRGSADRKIEFIWVVRRRQDLEWVRPELDTLRAASARMNLTIRIFVTREGRDGVESVQPGSANILLGPHEKSPANNISALAPTPPLSDDDIHPSSSSASSAASSLRKPTQQSTVSELNHRPSLPTLITSFIDSTIRGPITVYASGPPEMITDVRRRVAESNDAGKVWKGDERGRVELVADDRVE
ncbi:ferric reductase like transmembrane component like protein [Zymoseptoria brevis]|uniref:Ferric reductase like transmembrane component like protein n=1 Tax=Zymoseptoria brevis TaxID=1047168 RepID=A0A0F4G4E9_9PEZI|nr:ferric reductase like transmembrane component like protein [Zymoseptoria brevis]